MVIAEIPKHLVQEIVVVDNASDDATAAKAAEAGATVLREDRKGYGNACLKGIEYLRSLPEMRQPEIVVFLDADHSDFPGQMEMLVQPILTDGMDLVIGSRVRGNHEKNSMTSPQKFGNWLATRLLRVLYSVRYTDLGPFRAIRFKRLLQLGMKDRSYGWTVEMQLKAAKAKFKTTEVPVDYRKRIGKSKISGTVKGTAMAGFKILWTIFKYI